MFKNNALILAGTVIAVALIAAFVWVDVANANTDKLVEFFKWLLTIVPIVIVGLINTRNNSVISQQVANVENATNGALTARLDAQTEMLKQHTNDAINSALATYGITSAATDAAAAVTNASKPVS